MLKHMMIVATSLVGVIFFGACMDAPSMPTPVPTSTLTPTAAPTSTLTPTPTSTPTPSPYAGYLAEEIPPCTPVLGSPVDPCEPGTVPRVPSAAVSAPPYLGDAPEGAKEALTLDYTPEFVIHIVVRGTYLPGTERCTSGTRYRSPPYLGEESQEWNGIGQIKCFADIRVHDYILGHGPSRLTLQVYWEFYGAREEVIEGLREFYEHFLVEGEPGTRGIIGREMVLFLFPSIDHATEVWQAFGGMDVQRQEDGTVIAVHPGRDAWRSLRPNEYGGHLSVLEPDLSRLEQDIVAAHQARVSEYGGRIGADTRLPSLISDIHDLDEFMVSTGAYDDPDNPPAQPPPVPGEGDPLPDIGVDDATPTAPPAPPGGESTPTPVAVP